MSETTTKARDILVALRAEKPRFHGREQAGSQDFSIGQPVLDWMLGALPAAPGTLETGCGYTTAVLAALEARHTVISPFAEEHALIEQWCSRHDVSCATVEFIARASQGVLPSLPNGPLDLVIIDGDHAFPAPFIDWYYTADRVRNGGFVVIDDIQIPTGALLRSFLSTEITRWRQVAEIGQTVIFQRITDDPVAEGIPWTHQPFCKVSKGRNLFRRIRNRLRRPII